MSGEIRAAYDKWHEHFDVDAEADAPWHQLVRAHLGPLGAKRILEIGCGRGGFSASLAAAQPRLVCGVDFSRTAVVKAAAFGRSADLARVRFLAGDILAIPHRDDTFDVVVSCETVEHVSDPRLAVRECARVLRHGGQLALTTPNYLGVLGLYRLYRRLTGRPFTEVGQPVNRVTMLPMTCAWVRAAGLRITGIESVGHYLPIPRRPPVRLDSGAPSRGLLKWLGLHSLVVATKP